MSKYEHIYQKVPVLTCLSDMLSDNYVNTIAEEAYDNIVMLIAMGYEIDPSIQSGLLLSGVSAHNMIIFMHDFHNYCECMIPAFAHWDGYGHSIQQEAAIIYR